ncbi:MAG TPA: hypothetical protein VF327_03260 [Gaiellaceae bacterium]
MCLVPTDLYDRIMDWHDELLRIAPRLHEMPDAARQAVYAVVEEFLREDSGFTDSRRAVRAA